MKITRKQLTELFNEFYGTNTEDILNIKQTNVKYKKGKFPVLFLDEYSRSSNDIKNATLQLLLDKKLHNHILPYFGNERCQIILADNPDNGDYDVESLDPASLDRVAKYDVEIDVSGWLEWARENKVNKIVIDFIINNQDKIHYIPKDSSEISATPRSWTMLAKYIDKFDKIDDYLHFEIIRSKIGDIIGSQFYLFYKNYKDVITIKDIEKFILKDNKKLINKWEELGEKVNQFIEKMESITKLEMANELFSKYKDDILDENKDIPVVLGYLYGLDLEILNSLLKDIKSKDIELYLGIVSKDNNKNLVRKIINKIK